MEAHPLSEWEALASGAADEVLLAAADPSHVVGHPSGVLRNALLLAAVRWRAPCLRVVAVRERGGRPDAARKPALRRRAAGRSRRVCLVTLTSAEQTGNGP